MPMADTTAWWPATPSYALDAGRICAARLIEAEKAAPEIAQEAIDMVRAALRRRKAG